MIRHNMNDEKQLLVHHTPRMELILNMAGRGECVADIGCDHAYLSVLLARAGWEKVIASDVAVGPHDKALENIRRFKAEGQVELRLGDGIGVLAEGEADTVVIAGMGGTLIADILESNKEIARSVSRFILQPMSSSEDLRRYLYENGYSITREIVVFDLKLYTVMEVINKPTPSYSEFDVFISPAMRNEGGELYERYFKKRKKDVSNIVESLKKSETAKEQLEYYSKIYDEFCAVEAR